MPRVAISLEVQGLTVSFDGDAGVFEREVRPLMEGVAAGSWRPRGEIVAAPAGPGEPAPIARESPVPDDRAVPAPPPPARPSAEMAPSPSPEAPAAPAKAAPAGGGFDFRPLLRTLGQDRGRRGEREAVLTALAGLAAEGKRDATPAEVVAWLEANGFPARDLKPRPILAKLCHRKGLAVPGVARNTFRATPAGAAHIARLVRGE